MNRRTVHKRGFGDWIRRGIETVSDLGSNVASRISEAVGAVIGSNRLIKSFRDNLTKHGDKKIVNIQIVREPLAKAVNAFGNLLTAGKLDEVARAGGQSAFFHLYSILTLDDGTKLRYEKNARPELEVTNGSIGSNAESVNSSGGNIPLRDFIERSIKRMGEDRYISYDALRNNCQDFLLNSLEANGLLQPDLALFIKQDTTKLIEESPSFGQKIGNMATNIGGKMSEVWNELFRKRGGYRSMRIGGNILKPSPYNTKGRRI
jgi:hypothetical protein